MSLLSISAAAQSASLRDRIAACVAQQTAQKHPINIIATEGLQWRCAAEPGWGEAWDSAVAAGNADPGADPAVIPDSWILAAVQKHLGVSSDG